jgi:hypothetical protein
MNNILQNIIDKENKFDNLEKKYQNLDTKSYSNKWDLFDFQEKAIKNAISVLDLYYNKLDKSKESLYQKYIEYGLNETLVENEINIPKDNDNFELLDKYLESNNEFINLKEFINRMSFWMATGSGKTLIIIKLIEVLFLLIKKKLIPKKDFLILAPKDGILNQIKEHVEEFNKMGDLKIQLNDLRNFEKIKNNGRSFFDHQYIQVFYYRADNIRDYNVKEFLSYKTIYNKGNWYLFVDEAHKGDESDSIRQQYYKILSSNGFMFNFSATFTEHLDKAATCYNLQLSKYITRGYGKHLKLSTSTFSKFDKEKINNKDRKKIILESLIIFTVLKKYREKIKEIDSHLYHEPLLTTLTNEVNTSNAELKVFFRELATIAKGDYDDSIIEEIKNDLRKEFNDNRNFYYEDEGLDINFIKEINTVTQNDILKYVFNANEPGSIEVTGIEGNSKELAFSLTSSDKDFACIVIGDVSKWKNDELENYYYSKDILKESYLNNIEDEESNINILLGSRVFAEGWDTNRLNIVNYINIGMSSKNQKYILQTLGRGLRIEPIRNQRRRLKYIDHNLKNREGLQNIDQKKLNVPLETLFIFSTNREAIDTIIQRLESEKDEYINIPGIQKNDEFKKQNNLIPIFRDSEEKIKEPYLISKKDYIKLKIYIEKKLKLIPIYTYNKVTFKDILYSQILEYENVEENPKFKDSGNDSDLPMIELLKDISIYLNKQEKEFWKFKIQEDEIVHYNKISANLAEKEIEKIKEEITESLQAKEDFLTEKKESRGNKTTLKYIKKSMMKDIEIIFEDHKDNNKKSENIKINSGFLNHYYNPIIYTSEDNIKRYFKNIITVESEINFLKKLNEELKKENHIFNDYDWWGFSKLQENLDDIYIPYFENKDNKGYRKFYPDFIFWLKKNNKYKIVFVDPKSSEMGIYLTKQKIKGYKKHLENIEGEFKGNKITIKLWLFNPDKPSEELYGKDKSYWSNDFDEMFR